MVLRNQSAFWKFLRSGSLASGFSASPPLSQAPGTHRFSSFSFLSREPRLPSFSLEQRADHGQRTNSIYF